MVRNKTLYKMMISGNSYLKSFMAFCILLTTTISSAKAQISIYTLQNFNFGSFYQGNSGGTISISTAGMSTSTGDIILINNAFNTTQAIFEIEAPENTTISLTMGPDAILTGSNGGTMVLHAGSADPEFPLHLTNIPPARTTFRVSGKLTVGNRQNSPPGTYQGTISITVNQQ